MSRHIKYLVALWMVCFVIAIANRQWNEVLAVVNIFILLRWIDRLERRVERRR